MLRCILHLAVNKKLGADFRQSNYFDGEVELSNSRKTLGDMYLLLLRLSQSNNENILINVALAFMN